MKTRIILTSMLAICIAGAAHATPVEENSFPGTGMMLENRSYLNQANETNIVGLDGGNVTAQANYDWDETTLEPGYYLPANTTIDGVRECAANSYCPGSGENTVHYSGTAQGIYACPTGYTTSGYVKYISELQCSTGCTVANAGLTNATAVSGKKYAGGTELCIATSCGTGYHTQLGAMLINAFVDGSDDEEGSYVYTNNGNVYDGGWNITQTTHGLTGSDSHAFVRYYINGNNEETRVYGHGRCSTRASTGGVDGEYAGGYLIPESTDLLTTLTDETGQNGAIHCYCQINGYTPAGGTMQSVNSKWVFVESSWDGTAATCSDSCAERCAFHLYTGWYDQGYAGVSTELFQKTILSSLGAGCDANIYNITWNDALLADVTANNAGTATYGGNINTPVKVDPSAVPTGKIFRGWSFVNPNAQQAPSINDPQ